MSVSLIAQNEAYTGPAKNNVASFWKEAKLESDNLSASELNTRIRNLQYSLDRIKEKDPAYNVTEMETILSELKKKRKENQAADAHAYHGDKTQTPPIESLATFNAISDQSE